MVGELNSLVELLRSVNEALHSSLARMDDAVSQLSSDVDHATSGITVHQTVTRVLEGAISGLGEITGQARRIAPASGKGASLEELSRRYTMHSERRIHQRLLTGAGEPRQANEELDGNVEFF